MNGFIDPLAMNTCAHDGSRNPACVSRDRAAATLWAALAMALGMLLASAADAGARESIQRLDGTRLERVL
jgi:hypothetical protein